MKKAVCLVIAVCTVLFTRSCAAGGRESRSTSFIDLFDTAATVIAYSENEKTFSAEADSFHSELEEYNNLYDIYNSYDGINNIQTINDSAGKAPVEVDQRIIDLLEFGMDMYELSDGKVNIAFGAVLEIWHNYRTLGINDPENAGLPTMDELEAAAKHTNIDDVVIDSYNKTVYLRDPEMSLDVGAIAKGYAVERVCRQASENMWTSAAVSIGGNVRTIGTKAGGPWVIGIENPLGGEYMCRINAEDLSVVTSGNYQRYYTVDGVQYHHIIDPDTLYPAEYVSSVTIIAKDSGYADGLSTALFLMDSKTGLEFVESLEDVEALWVFKDGTQQMSSGLEAFISE